MKITVKFFASLREAVGADKIGLELADGTSVGDMLARLIEKYPDVKGHQNIIIAVNRKYQNLETILQDGDEVAIMPPISGG